MLQKVIRAIDKYRMLDNCENVTVAISGGADSVCLLFCMLALREKYGYSLSAVHINHNLRAEESNRDEEFVKALCHRLSVPLAAFSVDVYTQSQKTGESTELAARNLRYAAFKKHNIGLTATAHTADDNLETALYNMSRGTGIRGIAGIPPKRDIFIRPLIFCTRSDIEEYLQSIGETFVTDSSNMTDEYTRNFIRHNVVPLLQKINPAVSRSVGKMCENLREDEDFLSHTARKIYMICLRDGALDTAILKMQHPAIFKRIIWMYIYENFGIKLDSLHLNLCAKLVHKGGRTGISQNKTVFCDENRFYAEKQNEVSFVTKMSEISREDFKINNLLLKNGIDCDKIKGSLVVRVRTEGDFIRLSGRGCTKTLKKLMSEMKIPPHLRKVWPIASDDEGVVWVYGAGVAERTCTDENTKRAIVFEVTKSNNP